MPADDTPVMIEPGADAGAPPMQMAPDDEMMGQMGQIGMMGMMMMQQMSEMMELCIQMMQSMMEAPHVDTRGKP
jgi:hypothetical protein